MKPKLPSTLAQNYLAGQPIIVASGYHEHGLNFVLWENHFIICNRTGASTTFRKSYRLNDTQNIESLIPRLSNLENQDSMNYENFIANLQRSNTISERYTICDRYALPPQSSGNCGYACFEDAIHVILQMCLTSTL